MTGKLKIRTNKAEQIFTPAVFGQKRLTQKQLHGGDTVEEAAKIFTAVLDGTCTEAQREVVATNAGVAIHCRKSEQSVLDCIAEARESILSKRALEQFKKLVN